MQNQFNELNQTILEQQQRIALLESNPVRNGNDEQQQQVPSNAENNDNASNQSDLGDDQEKKASATVIQPIPAVSHHRIKIEPPEKFDGKPKHNVDAWLFLCEEYFKL